MENNRKKLPVLTNSKEITVKFVGQKDLSETKEYISYSELVLWMECSYRHFLKYIQKINVGDTENEHSAFGACCHTNTEEFLKTKTIDKVVLDKSIALFDETITRLEKRQKITKEQWDEQVPLIMEQVPTFIEESFGSNWEFVGAEVELLEPIPKVNKLFKGYIDGIIKLANNKYVILDWKTSVDGWSQARKTDKIKAMQLAFYKYFWSVKNNIPLSDIDTYFILLKRLPKSTERCELVKIEITDKDIEDSLAKILEMQRFLKKNMFSKNKKACFFCEFKNTKHCT